MTDHSKGTAFWQQHKLPTGDWLLWQAGTLRIWAKRMAQQHEWQIFTARIPEERNVLSVGHEDPPPIESTWKRWAFKEEDETIQALPIMPENPVVVRPDSPVRIPKGNEVTFFVSVPLILQLFIGPQRNILIYEEPTVVLSKTWFGEPTAGEICYALRTGASRDFDGIKKGQHRVVCPVVVRNRSDEELNFQKLCIRAMHVNIHRGNNRLWTEEIEVSYLGKNSFSEVAFAKEPPRYEATHGIIGAAREPLARNFLKKSFDTLLSF